MVDRVLMIDDDTVLARIQRFYRSLEAIRASTDADLAAEAEAEAGDEAFMLAKHLPKVPVLIGAERAVTGRYAIENFGAEVAILDDGYQHWQLERDMDILLVDAVNVFGNDYILPRGTLREPISHISRADVCLMTKVDQAATGSCEYIRETVHRYNADAQIVESIHQPRCFILSIALDFSCCFVMIP